MSESIRPLMDRLSRPEHDPLTAEREAELGADLIIALADQDNTAERLVREELVNRHLRLVLSIGRQYQHLLDREEILAVGALALTQAAERWHPQKGQMFPWAERWITTALTRAADASRMIRIPQQVAYKAGLAQKKANELADQLGRDLTRQERDDTFSDTIGFDALPQVSDSLDRDWVTGAGGGRSVADTIVDPDQDPHLQTERKLAGESLHDALQELTEIEREVVVARFGLDGKQKLTLAELGARHGVSGEAMRRIEASALAKLRHPALLVPIFE